MRLEITNTFIDLKIHQQRQGLDWKEWNFPSLESFWQGGKTLISALVNLMARLARGKCYYISHSIYIYVTSRQLNLGKPKKS